MMLVRVVEQGRSLGAGVDTLVVGRINVVAASLDEDIAGVVVHLLVCYTHQLDLLVVADD